VAPSDATAKNHSIGAQLHILGIQLLKKDFGKFTSCRTFGAHALVHSEPFWEYRYEVWHLLSALYSDTREKFLYRCTSAVLALKYCFRIFFRSLSYIYEVVRTKFSADFWTFRNFWPQFRKNCGATWRRKWELCNAFARAIPCEKKLKTASKSAYKRQRCALCTPRQHSAPDSERDQQKNPYFRTYSRRSLYHLPQTLHGDRARPGHQKRRFIFRSNIYFFLQDARKNSA